mmetsp:Transcript_52239/g.145772  ORF Transcript_52239/g.145772 Transcript_52239/m.145772 type:complete len:209 (-) Transcript_52239:326-952(-)
MHNQPSDAVWPGAQLAGSQLRFSSADKRASISLRSGSSFMSLALYPNSLLSLALYSSTSFLSLEYSFCSSALSGVFFFASFLASFSFLVLPGSCFSLSSFMRLTIFTTSSSLFCWPPLMPCSFKCTFRSMMLCFKSANSFVSAGLRPALSCFLGSFLLVSFFDFASVASTISWVWVVSGTSDSGTSASLDTKLPNLCSSPLAILQAST